MHVPSFLVGSLVSGGAFLLVNQQMAYRERMTYKLPLARWMEDRFRSKWKEVADQMTGERQQIRQQLNLRQDGDIAKKWNQIVVAAQDYFSKKD